MANKNEEITFETVKGEDVDQDMMHQVQRGRQAYRQNSKMLNILGVVVIAVIGGYLGYKQFVQKPNIEKSENAVFHAQQWYDMDSLNYALKGDGQNPGFEKIIDKYSGTPAANLSHYYAGTIYLRQGNFAKAVENLKKFDGEGSLVQFRAWGALGDALMEQNKASEAIDFYKKAASGKGDQLFAPTYLFRAALASEKAGKTEEAKKLYREVKEKYPYAPEARDMDKYLARLGDYGL
jgi:TolA-binding protein